MYERDTVHLVFAYDAPGTDTLRRVDIGVSVHTQNNETLFVVLRSYMGPLLTVRSGKGTLRCRINRPAAGARPISGGRALWRLANDEGRTGPRTVWDTFTWRPVTSTEPAVLARGKACDCWCRAPGEADASGSQELV